MIVLPVVLFLFVMLLLPLVITGMTVDMVTVAVTKLGFAPGLAILLLAAIVIGSTINIPLYQKYPKRLQPAGMPWSQGQRTVVALNVGGGLIPVVLALYQLTRGHVLPILITTAIVTVVSYCAAQIVPGTGIRMNAMIAPLTAVVCAWLLGAAAAPSIAFAGGILGTLIGADLLHLREIERLSPGVLSIGGAGVLDGIALCGLFALLLA
ncbi:DUF1614 domain-containing protein [Leptolyngbya cf. ectocarpi LEGE 11479]|uniref:DUF1614 domain-containing protein n=1 Tax=Leptolyngbya cf. ectocarpi LEGE 11479 TaxID=1828722 RepID=A0A928WXG3_LEPEC|nr:DUF1614 domain-containing protein [Leptolyngbya ectocarpi]MBE9065214.1 DUF1614 domain-containing protein [Leptolyngbya cf. ectocarpi LEGE 11479]